MNIRTNSRRHTRCATKKKKASRCKFCFSRRATFFRRKVC